MPSPQPFLWPQNGLYPVISVYSPSRILCVPRSGTEKAVENIEWMDENLLKHSSKEEKELQGF